MATRPRRRVVPPLAPGAELSLNISQLVSGRQHCEAELEFDMFAAQTAALQAGGGAKLRNTVLAYDSKQQAVID